MGRTRISPVFVPEEFDVPARLDGPGFHLEPLSEDHNESDYAAWTSSMDHIRATPGFERWRWPRQMTLEENRADLRRHADDFSARRGFTYTVVSDQGETIGCVYIYPAKSGSHDAEVHSWVTADHAELDGVLYRTVQGWLERDWPFAKVEYAPRSSD